MFYPLRKIVVGVAEIDGPDPVLASAAALAERSGAELHAVRSYEVPHLIWDAYLQAGAVSETGVEAEFAQSVRKALEDRVSEVMADRPVRLHVLRDTPDRAICAVAEQEQADLIVIGATRPGILGRRILGTTAQRVLRRAGAPVLVLRGALPQHLRRVLLASELTPFCATVQEVGLDVLESSYAADRPELRSVLVVAATGVLPPPLRQELVQVMAEEQLQAFLAERRPRPAAPRPVVRFGAAAPEVLAEALEWKADLLVLGTHGRHGFDRLMLGSVAEAVLRDLRCAALVVPARAAERLQLPVPAAEEPLITAS